jgi:hypothetical protein
MRKIIVLLLISLLSIFSINAQGIDTLPGEVNHEYLRYMKKRSNNKTLGWVFLGAGVALFGTAYLSNVANGWNGTNLLDGMAEVGIASTALSIPFFIIAGENKRKARLALKGERLTSAIIFDRITYPALSLSIKL